jgi:hypothetical protein
MDQANAMVREESCELSAERAKAARLDLDQEIAAHEVDLATA